MAAPVPRRSRQGLARGHAGRRAGRLPDAGRRAAAGHDEGEGEHGDAEDTQHESIKKFMADDGTIAYRARVSGTDRKTGKRVQPFASFPTLLEARRWRDATRSALATGKHQKATPATVGDALDAWLASREKSLRSDTVAGYRRTIHNYIKPALGEVKVASLTAARVRAFYADLERAGVGTRMIQLCHLRLRSALAHAGAGALTDGIDLPSHAKSDRDTWTADEAQRFLTAAEASAYGPIWTAPVAHGDAARGGARAEQEGALPGPIAGADTADGDGDFGPCVAPPPHEDAGGSSRGHPGW